MMSYAINNNNIGHDTSLGHKFLKEVWLQRQRTTLQLTRLTRYICNVNGQQLCCLLHEHNNPAECLCGDPPRHVHDFMLTTGKR